MHIHFGPLAQPLTEQLRGVLPVGVLIRYQRDTESITRLSVRGLLTPSEAQRARRRLVKAIEFIAKHQKAEA